MIYNAVIFYMAAFFVSEQNITGDPRSPLHK